MKCIMVLFSIFAGLATLGIVIIVLQNLAIRAAISTKDIMPESDFLPPANKCFSGKGKTSSKSAPNAFCPPISILKPLKGVDDDLFENLSSFCNQNYPDYEIIFGLEEKNDPALQLAQEIRKLYPHKKISIVLKESDSALNPKINNLISPCRAAKFPYILISDSDVRVAPDYLMAIVQHMQDPDVGLVCNFIRGIGSQRIGALLENLHLNSFVIGNVAIMTKFLKMPVVVGKSTLLRKKDCESMELFEKVKNVLGEDYVMGNLMDKNGKKVVTSGHVVNAVNHHKTINQFIKRHVRWGKLRLKLGGIGYISEILTNAVFIACLSLVVLGPTTSAVALLAAASLVTIIGDYCLGKRIRSAHHFFHYLLSPIKDIIIGFIWFAPFFSRTVMWRRHKYKITKGSLLVPLHNRANEETQ